MSHRSPTLTEPSAMPERRGRLLRRVAPVALLASALMLEGCGPELVIRLTTRVYEDASLQRRLEVAGRTGDQEVPEDRGWLANDIGLVLTRPEAWRRVHESPGRLVAEGFFPDVASLPGTLSHLGEGGRVADRDEVLLRVDEGVILRRWIYREVYGGPFGEEAIAEALDELAELAVELLRQEVRRDFGSRVDTFAAEAFLRGEARALAGELLEVRRAAPGERRLAERQELRVEVLARHGMTAAPMGDEDDGFWSAQGEVMLDWLRARLAAALSLGGRVVAPADLSFLPRQGDDESLETVLGAAVDRTWGEDEFLERISPMLEALGGSYEGNDGRRFRFELRLELPGRLIATNGTPDEHGVFWLFREDDIALGEVRLEAESMELDTGALRAMGARRRFEPTELVQLRDLVAVRDPDGVLRDWLRTGVERRSLQALLEESDSLPDELKPLASELLDLLDPDGKPL